jgi:hypothetical protein
MYSKQESVLAGQHSSGESWFQFAVFSDSDHTSYNYEDFRKLIEKQVYNNLKVNPATQQVGNSPLFLHNFNLNNLDEKLFSRLIHCQSSVYGSQYFPLFTYHSTQNATVVNSILSHGYLIPGETHPSKGYTLKMANGDCYGDGIYTSHIFDFMKWYSYLDNKANIQVIINVVFPKRVKCNIPPYHNPSAVISASSASSTISTQDALGLAIIPSLDYGEKIYYEYDKRGNVIHYDTLYSEHGKIFVSANAENVIPLGVLTLGYHSPSSPNTGISPLLTIGNKPYIRSKGIRYESCIVPKITIPCYHFFGDYHLIDVSLLKEQFIQQHPKKKIPIIKHVFVIPPSLCNNNNNNSFVINQIQHFINGIPSYSTRKPSSTIKDGDLKDEKMTIEVDCFVQKYCSFYSKDFHLLTNSSSFQGYCSQLPSFHLTKYTTQQDSSVGDDIVTAINTLCSFVTNSQDNEESLQIIYFFICKPKVSSFSQLHPLYEKWKKYLLMKQLQFKIIFLNDFYEDLVFLKSYGNTMNSSFEANYYYHATSSLESKMHHKKEKKDSSLSLSSIPSRSFRRSLCFAV